jgi:hypothetical protein
VLHARRPRGAEDRRFDSCRADRHGARSLVRAPALQAGPGEFDPLAPYHAHVAQWQRRPLQPRISGGSSPPVRTIAAASAAYDTTTGHDGLVTLDSLIRSPHCVRFADGPPRPLTGTTSGCGSIWQSARFGAERLQVRFLPPRRLTTKEVPACYLHAGPWKRNPSGTELAWKAMRAAHAA